MFKYEKYLSLFLCQSQVGVESLKTQGGGVDKTLDKPEYDFCTYSSNFISFSFFIFRVGILISPPHGILLSLN